MALRVILLSNPPSYLSSAEPCGGTPFGLTPYELNTPIRQLLQRDFEFHLPTPDLLLEGPERYASLFCGVATFPDQQQQQNLSSLVGATPHTLIDELLVLDIGDTPTFGR